MIAPPASPSLTSEPTFSKVILRPKPHVGRTVACGDRSVGYGFGWSGWCQLVLVWLVWFKNLVLVGNGSAPCREPEVTMLHGHGNP
jgi:hypothetical protein